jgi:2-iminobutanoate/2-iminopropanoate deaminase
MADYAAVHAVHAEFFSAPYPARTAVAVAALPLGALVEADVAVG